MPEQSWRRHGLERLGRPLPHVPADRTYGMSSFNSLSDIVWRAACRMCKIRLDSRVSDREPGKYSIACHKGAGESRAPRRHFPGQGRNAQGCVRATAAHNKAVEPFGRILRRSLVNRQQDEGRVLVQHVGADRHRLLQVRRSFEDTDTQSACHPAEEPSAGCWIRVGGTSRPRRRRTG